MNPLCAVNRNPIMILGHQNNGITVITALLSQLTELPVTLDIPAVRGRAMDYGTFCYV